MNAVSPQSAETRPAAPWTQPLLLTALAGSFLVNMTAQFANTNLADIQGELAASADEVSWATTLYVAGNCAGIIVSGALVSTFGLRRYFIGSAVVFAGCALGSALAPSLLTFILLRVLQGVAGGGFGPMAFVAVFTLCKGPRLPFGLALLGFVLLVSVTAGPIVAGFTEAALGWHSLFFLQFCTASGLVLAGLRWIPGAKPNWKGLQMDWAAVGLLAVAAAMAMVFLSQGTRRFWLDDGLVVWSLVACVGAGAGFLVLCRYSPMAILSLDKFIDRRFGTTIALNLLFRASLAVTFYLIPLELALTQSYRPEQTASVLIWCLVPQVVAFPFVWNALHWVDGRLLIASGLLICAIGSGLAAFTTHDVAGEQLRLSLAILGVGQMLFMVPNLVIGAGTLKPQDLPTASLAFNLTTVGGTTLGVGVLSNFITEREKFHSGVLTDQVSLLSPLATDRLSALVSVISNRIVDESAAITSAVMVVVSGVRREAWVLAIGDGFICAAIVLAAIALLAKRIDGCPPLGSFRSRKDAGP